MPIIFQQIEELLDGRKTQTRRVAKMDERVVLADGDIYSVADLAADPSFFNRSGDWDFWSSSKIMAVLIPSGRTKWEVGRCQSIIPKRGRPALWLGPDGQIVEDWRAEWVRLEKAGAFNHIEHAELITRENLLYAVGYSQPWMRIERIRLEHVQDISEEDAKAEGASPDLRHLPSIQYEAGYRNLWHSINARKGTRWEDNPLVFALDLKRVGRFGE